MEPRKISINIKIFCLMKRKKKKNCSVSKFSIGITKYCEICKAKISYKNVQ